MVRVALYATLGVLASGLGYSWDTWQFASLLGLFWASDLLGHMEGREQQAELDQALLDKARELLREAELIQQELQRTQDTQ
jgi:hypothetical protein